MSRLQTIENALSSINAPVFQELCDCFLALRNPNYSAFSRTGSQSGKQKTIKGTPDSFLLLPNDKYVFVEMSTNSTRGVSKLAEDIGKCIDSSKTGIPIEKIDEIIICINFNLNPSKIETLKILLAHTRIRLTIHTLDSLAVELHLHHSDLTCKYLGLPLDTGQIVSIDTFITEYSRASKGISTPLDNTFLHRENELKELIESIHESDFIILTGSPGIGKTKLALEAINRFLVENLSFSAYCISYKSHTLLDDLYQYFEKERDYLLFVDDANRIDAFQQIIGFYKASRKGKLKIIITVRDYAFQEIELLCNDFSPNQIRIEKFTDAQIIDIVKAHPFNILNPDYQQEIVRIADGNPRLAIMTALLAKEKQNILALSDMSDLFEKYFSTFVKDNGEFADEINIKCLGLIAFFYTIPYINKKITSSVLRDFGIDYSDFIDSIERMDKLELVDIQFEHVKIPEQNLASFFFYKAFVKDNLLSFQTLLTKYFESNTHRFTDCVIPANNIFGYQNVMDKLKPHLQSYWKLASNNENCFRFLNTFWYYLQIETLEFIFNEVNALPQVNSSTYQATLEKKTLSYDRDPIITLLGNFFGFLDNLKDALELSFDYIRKKPDQLPELIHEIRENLTFDKDDVIFDFERQRILFQVLLDGLDKNDLLYSIVFFELSKTYLCFKFHNTKGGRNHTYYIYNYPIPNIPSIQEFRKNIWNAIEANFSKNPIEAFNLLESYSSVNPDVIKEIMEFDIPFLLTIIEKHLTNTSFEHCRYVQNQIRWCKRNSVSHPLFDALSQQFVNEVYEIFLKIDWDRYRDKENYDYDDYEEFNRLKEAEIKSSFVFNNLAEGSKFVETFVFLKKIAKNDWNYNTTLDIVIDENCNRNPYLGFQILELVIQIENEINYTPQSFFLNYLKTSEMVKNIWSLIQKYEFKDKILWELSFYNNLDDSLISDEYIQSILNTIGNIKVPITIHFDRLQRFLPFAPGLFQKILEIIVVKNEIEESKIPVWGDFFSQHFDKLGTDITLIKRAYLQQEKINPHFDYKGNGFLSILNRDGNFLIEFVNSLYSDKQLGASGKHKDFGFIWQVENIEPELRNVFDLITKKEPYFRIHDYFINSCFKNLQGKQKDKATKFLIEYCRDNHDNHPKMNLIVKIVRNSMKELYEPILLLFLSLNQDVNTFSKIWWRGNGGSYTGDVIIGDIEAAEWKDILSIVETSGIGIKLIPIKRYLGEQIESCLRSGNWQRQKRFLGKD